jgi:hypothetical protein
MFGMSGTELIIVLVLALVLIGPDDLPDAAKTVGKTIREARRSVGASRQDNSWLLYLALLLALTFVLVSALSLSSGAPQ